MNNNDISVGVDIESISRFKGLNIRKYASFLSRIFTKKEIDYCLSKRYPAQHLAVRFAGKEAVIKALSSLGENNVYLKDIEINRGSTDIPGVKLSGYNIEISLSHSGKEAIAFVVAWKTKC